MDSNIKDILDERRKEEQEELMGLREPSRKSAMDFEGHGVLIVAKATVSDSTPLCLGLGSTYNKVRKTIRW